jgi:phage repressor protein C with HTH and peptisase S24 domain
MKYHLGMSKKAKFKKNLDPFTNAADIEKVVANNDKKKSKRTPAEKNRRDRHLQKEIVKQLTDDLVKLSEKDILEEPGLRDNPHKKTNEVVYTIKPVKTRDE